MSCPDQAMPQTVTYLQKMGQIPPQPGRAIPEISSPGPALPRRSTLDAATVDVLTTRQPVEEDGGDHVHCRTGTHPDGVDRMTAAGFTEPVHPQ
jgi:hypothetical protein